MIRDRRGQKLVIDSPFREKDDALPDDLHLAYTDPIPLWQDVPPDRRLPFLLRQTSRLDPLAFQSILHLFLHCLHLVPLALGDKPSVLLSDGLTDPFSTSTHGRSNGPEGRECGEDGDLTEEMAGLPVVNLNVRVSTA
jgi:hypothetical protein